MSPAQAAIHATTVLLIGAAVTAVAARDRRACAWLALAFVTVASTLLFWGASARLFATGSGMESTVVAQMTALGASLTVAIDQLSAFFLMIISVMAFLSTLYSVGHMRLYEEEHPARYWPILLLFFAGVIGVVSVRDWLFFLIFWECMALCSYFLVIYSKGNPVSLRAGLKYLIVTHVATVLMLVAAIVVWHTSEPNSFSFAAAGQVFAQLAQTQPVVLHVLLALWLIGFATKAGILPFGDWLPDAYPAAPSGATAAFAGTMTNLGVYGVLRIFVDLLPASEFSAVWGVLIALLGTGSIFVGTITALSQDDVKRLMSFHVIGQTGYMFLGIGMGIYFLPSNPTLALIGILAGTFHLLNGVCYKSLLFCTAGSIRVRAGTRALHDMGGLARVMPLTALMAAIGSLSIAGVPPFNGFASKWLIYQLSIIGGIGFPLLLLFGLVALFISLVTLASLLKYLGAAFLGQPSEHVAALQGKRNDVPAVMQAPQVVLGLACVFFGLFPTLPLTIVHRAIAPLATALSGPTLAGTLGTSPLGLSFTAGGVTAGVWHPLAASVALAICVALSYGVARVARAPSRVVPVWFCGAQVSSQEAHFEAHGLYDPFRRAFERVYVTTGTPRIRYPVAFAKAFDVDAWLYGPLVRAGQRVAERVSRSHAGVPQLYLVWQLAGMVVVLVALFWVMR